MRIIVGISGASGVVMGYEMLKALRMQEDCEIHLVITQGAIENFKYETDMDIKEVMITATTTRTWRHPSPAAPSARTE